MKLGVRSALWLVGACGLLGACWCGVEFWVVLKRPFEEVGTYRVLLGLAAGALLTSSALAFGLDRLAMAFGPVVHSEHTQRTPPRIVSYLEESPAPPED